MRSLHEARLSSRAVSSACSLLRCHQSPLMGLRLGRVWECQQQHRDISDEQLNADGSQLAELFEKNMAKATRKREDAPRITTTRREALHLYREILRYSNLFVWKDAKGTPWRDVLRANARKEFDDARLETDPEIINKLIITGRDAVQRAVEAFWKKRNMIIEEEAARQNGGMQPPPMA